MTINTPYNVTLTEGQIGVILCSLEDSINNSNHIRSEGNQILQPFDEYCQSVDSIFEILEGAVDKYYEKVEKAQSKQPSMEWDDDFYDSLSEGKDQPQPVEEVSTVHTRKDMDLL